MTRGTVLDPAVRRRRFGGRLATCVPPGRQGVVVAAAAVFLAGCAADSQAGGALAGASVTASASAEAAVAPGVPVGDLAVYGTQFAPCTTLEIDAYPATIPRPSPLYYSGPWCHTDQNNVTYLWVYARPLSPELAADQIAQDVRVDAESITLDLSAQGYRRVCGVMEPGVRVDAAFEKPGHSVRIQVRALGSAAFNGPDPYAVAVAVSGSLREPAVPDGVPGPAC